MGYSQYDDIKDYQQRYHRFIWKNRLLLSFLAIVLVFLWFFPRQQGLSIEEKKVWERVRQAELHLWRWREDLHIGAGGADPWQLGLIGLEWSPLTTTLGSLEAKRTACQPSWSAIFLREFHRLGLKKGDRIAIFSSSSFPGLLLNVLEAAEHGGFQIALVVSLGASTWGANVPEAPWPVMASELRRVGLLHSKAQYYTLGGNDENGGGIAPEGIAIMERAAAEEGVPILRGKDLQEMIDQKIRLVRNFSPKLVVSIGGSHANMGEDEEILSLPGGLHLPTSSNHGGDGLIGKALREGYPVLHLLNLKDLSLKYGIPYNVQPSQQLSSSIGWKFSLLGIILFMGVLAVYKRWQISDDSVGGVKD